MNPTLVPEVVGGAPGVVGWLLVSVVTLVSSSVSVMMSSSVAASVLEVEAGSVVMVTMTGVGGSGRRGGR